MTYNEQYSLSKGDNHYDNQTSEKYKHNTRKHRQSIINNDAEMIIKNYDGYDRDIVDLG